MDAPLGDHKAKSYRAAGWLAVALLVLGSAAPSAHGQTPAKMGRWLSDGSTAWRTPVRPAIPVTAQRVAPPLAPVAPRPLPIPVAQLAAALPPVAPPPVAPPLPATPPVVAAPAEPDPAILDLPHEVPTELEAKLLLPLLAQERALLQNFGPDHPDVRAVRARIEVAREYVARQPRPAPVKPVVHAEPQPQPAPPAPLPPQIIERAVYLPAPAPASAAPAPTVVVPAPAPAPANDVTFQVLVQLIGILAALVVTLLVQLVALFIILRRFAGKLTPQVRVEVVSAGTAAEHVPGEVVTQRVYLDPLQSMRNVEAPMPADFGPDYADELRAQEESAKEQDAAVFRRIFEDNVKLREQLGTLESAAV